LKNNFGEIPVSVLKTLPAGRHFYVEINKKAIYEVSFSTNHLHDYRSFYDREIKVYKSLSKEELDAKYIAEIQKNSKIPAYDYTKKEVNNALILFDNTDAIKSVQLIKSSNNHISKRHKCEDKVAHVVVYEKEKKVFYCVKMSIHYCESCNQYFDFYESFAAQLKKHGFDLHMAVLNYYDENNRPIEFKDFELKEYSKLNLFGYRAGKHGLSTGQREKLLSTLIKGKYMTASEIKAHLSFLIRFQGDKAGLENAKRDWENDIQFVNKLIAKKNN
jgi:hypothetical protein